MFLYIQTENKDPTAGFPAEHFLQGSTLRPAVEIGKYKMVLNQ